MMKLMRNTKSKRKSNSLDQSSAAYFDHCIHNSSRFALLPTLRHIFWCEKGSASVEFTALAIPLFLPIFLFLQQFAALSSEESIARTLARESVRAFVSSSSDSVARAVAGEIIRVGGAELGLTDLELDGISLTFECSDSPCLSPNARIRARVEIKSPKSGRTVVASAQEYVSPWR